MIHFLKKKKNSLDNLKYGYSATSSTPLQIPNPGYVVNLSTQKDLSYTAGQSVIVYNTLINDYMIEDYVEEDSSILFIGRIDDYTITGDLQIIVDSSIGYGLTDSNNQVFTYSFWYINLTGESGKNISSTFSSIEMYGLTTLQQTSEKINGATAAYGLSPSTIYFNFNNGGIWYIDTVDQDFIADFTNIPTTDNRLITAKIIISQGSTAYIPSNLSIDGSPISPLWLNGSTGIGNPNQIDVIEFNFFRYGATWSNVLAKLNTFS